MRLVVLLNAGPRSREAERAEREARDVGRAFAEAGVQPDVRCVAAERLEAEAGHAAREADAVVLGGGDGTVSTGACALAGGATPLAVLPLGTFNHFAKDLGMPLDLREAARAVVAGRVREVDLGEVNGRPFLNNASIGLYPRAVAERDEKRQRGWAKWRAAVHALVLELARLRLLRVRVRAEGRDLRVRTPFVFVGNNRYEPGLPAPARRERLDGGELTLVVARTRSRLGLARLVLRGLVGRLQGADEVTVLYPSVARIEAGRRPIRLALDGEVLRIRPPLEFRVRPRALRVVAPPPP